MQHHGNGLHLNDGWRMKADRLQIGHDALVYRVVCSELLECRNWFGNIGAVYVDVMLVAEMIHLQKCTISESMLSLT